MALDVVTLFTKNAIPIIGSFVIGSIGYYYIEKKSMPLWAAMITTALTLLITSPPISFLIGAMIVGRFWISSYESDSDKWKSSVVWYALVAAAFNITATLLFPIGIELVPILLQFFSSVASVFVSLITNVVGLAVFIFSAVVSFVIGVLMFISNHIGMYAPK